MLVSGRVLHGGLVFCQQHSPGDKLPVVFAGGPMTYHLSSYQTSHFEVAFLRLASPNSWMVHFHIHHDTMKISGLIIISSVNNEIPSIFRCGAGKHFVAGCGVLTSIENMTAIYSCRVESDTQRVVLTKSNLESRLRQ